MKKLINSWNENASYSELNAIKFFDSCYILTNPNKNNPTGKNQVKVIPIKEKVISNGVASISNKKFVDKIKSELPDMELDNEELWKKL